MKRFYLLVIMGFLTAVPSLAQFTAIGSATQTNLTCYTLTPNTLQQAGAIWHTVPIDLTRHFDVFTSMFFGCADGGADGIVFVLQPQPTALGTPGVGMGYTPISPSIAVEFDTWQNTWLNDPPGDHLAVVSNGNNAHNAPTNLAGPVPILPNGGNVETCGYYDVRITWDPVAGTLSVWVNCSLRITYTGDIVNNIFGGNPNVYWGFVASTGASSNLHQVCITDFNNYPPQQLCDPATFALNAGPGDTFTWTPTAGVSNPAIANPTFSPDTTTTYSVTVNGPCATTRTRSWDITIGYDSVLVFDLGPDTAICAGQGLLIDLFRPGVENYTWSDGSTDSIRTITQPGTYWAELSNFCGVERDTIVITQEQDPSINLGNDTTLCVGDQLTLDATNPNATYLWQDNSTAAFFTVTSPGLYIARSENFCGVALDSIEVTYLGVPQAFSLGNDTILCNTATWLLDATQPNVSSYLWQNFTTAPTLDVQAPGTYFVTVSNLCGSNSDTVQVVYDQTPEVDLGPDTTLCLGVPYFRNATWTPLTTYQWQDNSTDGTYTITLPGTYQVTLTNTCGTATDEVAIDYLAPPVDPQLGPDTILCGNATTVLNPGLTGYDFVWQDGSTNPTFTVNQAGTYFVAVSNRCGTERDSILVRYETAPVVDLGNDSTLCTGQTLLLNASWSRASSIWDDGFTQPIRTISQEGRYAVTVTNLCGTARDEIQLFYLPVPDEVDLGGDRTLCLGDSVLLDAFQPGFEYLWQNGSSEPFYLVTFGGNYSVRVSNACGVASDQASINFLPQPTVDLGEDDILCNGEPIRLNGTSQTTNVSYLWDNGTTDPVRFVTEPGAYFLTVSNACDAVTDTIFLQARDCNCLVHVPSGFTPNDDTINDFFTWQYSCDLQAATMRIFDRWGGLVFESEDPAAGWNGRSLTGRECLEGVYVWVLNYSFIGESDGITQTQQRGTVTLLR